MLSVRAYHHFLPTHVLEYPLKQALLNCHQAGSIIMKNKQIEESCELLQLQTNGLERSSQRLTTTPPWYLDE